MKRKRLDRDIGWGFQGFPYYQFRLETEGFCGLVSLIDILSGEQFFWITEKAGNVPTTGAGMKWLQLVPDGKSRLITAMYKPDGVLSVCYVDVTERLEYDPDGVAAYVDKYLDVVFTPEGDVSVHDRDELDEALRAGDITEEQYMAAIKECDRILEEMCRDIPKTVELLSDIYKKALEKVRNGEILPLHTKYQNPKGDIK